MELEGAVGVVAGVGFVDEEEAGDDEAPGSHFGRSRRPRWGCLGGGADDGEKDCDEVEAEGAPARLRYTSPSW